MSHVDILGTEHFIAETTNFDGVVLVDFWAEWCGPCRMLGPVLHQIADESEWKVKLLKLNVDAEENQQLVMQYGVSSIPQVTLFAAGQKVDQFVWVQPKEAVLAYVQRHMPAGWEAATTDTTNSDPLAVDTPVTEVVTKTVVEETTEEESTIV